MPLPSPQPPELNALQCKAVTYDGGHLLIVAGPGTGKTHTLIHRIAWMTKRLKPSEKILAITFTNKAADEMKERLARFPGADGRFFVGTFHKFCLQLLREHGDRIGLPRNFRLAAPEELEALSKDLWPVATARERRERLDEISRLKSAAAVGARHDASLREYDQFLHSRSMIDFDDILREAWRLLRNHADISRGIRQTYRFVCVDEYQDINEIQHALLKLLAQDGVTVTAIGDPNQAIYGFRGSNVKFFESFPQDFPGAQVRELSENYRSTQNLLTAATQVIAVGAHGSCLRSGSAESRLSVSERRDCAPLLARIHTAGHLTVYEAPTDKAEAEYVVHQIERMVGGTSMFSHDSGRAARDGEGQRSFGDVAVLYRLKAQAKLLKEAFDRSGIPYQVSSERPAFSKEDIDKKLAAIPDENERLRWLDELALSQTEEVVDRNVEKVSLLTLHASKGLEFSVVFIVGCEQDLLPLALAGMESDAVEERRLFYVGMTRAREVLYLVRTKKRMIYGQTLTLAPSPFLADIEEELKAYEAAQLKPRKPEKAEQQMDLF